jgi:hypothetical protein
MTFKPRLLYVAAPKVFMSALLLAGLSACGGGGSDGGAGFEGESLAQSVSTSDESGVRQEAPPVPYWPGKLLITEVASNYYSDDVAWFEIYNPGSTPVSLADYKLNSSYVDTVTGIISMTPLQFDLPPVSIAPNSFLVIAAKPDDKLRDNGQMVYIRNGSKTPFWNGSGSLELIRGRLTADFVRFGDSATTPRNYGEWIGANPAPLPSGPDEHGKAIVRLAARGMVDTNSSLDWVAVNFATPAGPNDVGPSVTDSDHDGIPDSAKLAGGTYAGLDLYAMGARSGRRDLFMEIDYMQGDDPALLPRHDALKKLTQAFAAKNIALHLDTGDLHAPGFDPAAFNLGGGNPVPFAKCMELDLAGTHVRDGCASFYAYKGAYFDVRRKLVFHYALFANSQNLDGDAGPSGVAELSGADLLVSLGGYGFTVQSEIDRNMLTNLQAGTLMHEFGHNLGLRHGGNDEVNYKPNHYSVMNYMYQFAGLSAKPNSPYAAERYYLVNGLKGKTFCNLAENSPCSNDFIIDFSDGSGADLDEHKLSEAVNIGRGSVDGAYADWDDNEVWTPGLLARNINPLGGSGKTVLKDYNEWGNLTLTFSRAHSGTSLGFGPGNAPPDEEQSERRANPMNDGARNPTVEEPLPRQLHDLLRMLRHWR